MEIPCYKFLLFKALYHITPPFVPDWTCYWNVFQRSAISNTLVQLHFCNSLPSHASMHKKETLGKEMPRYLSGVTALNFTCRSVIVLAHYEW